MLDVTEVNNAVLAAVAAFGDPIDGPLDFVRIEDLGHGRFNVTFNDRRKKPELFQACFCVRH
jgi:hypothetical protein